MPDYKVISRRFRPQAFADVRGQEAIVATLKNALKNERIAHAYLFCGSRGTGKTTLARILAKALNCEQRGPDQEPCNECQSCREIMAGSSLSVIEIDGASNRGIEDIRQINETVGYASANRYQIYIIDEVHMLTKEAFNALLKTLEEPPANVKFFFATTEPHKVLPTIVSRCQRFNLKRLPRENIVAKLGYIAQEVHAQVDPGALELIAAVADGGMRDAESIFDQMISFTEGSVTEESVASVLGMMPRQRYFDLDLAGKEGRFEFAFELAQQVFSEGKDLQHFLEGLLEHFRHIACIQVAGAEAPYLSLSPEDRARYAESAKIYQKEQVLGLLDELITAQQQLRFSPAKRIGLEAILLRILRSHQRVTVDALVQRLHAMEQNLGKPQPAPELAAHTTPAPPKAPPAPVLKGRPKAPPQMEASKPSTLPPKAPAKPKPAAPKAAPKPAPQEKAPAAKPKPEPKAKAPSLPPGDPVKIQARRDTIMQFAAIELNGTLQKEHQ